MQLLALELGYMQAFSMLILVVRVSPTVAAIKSLPLCDFDAMTSRCESKVPYN